jgi:hypothetical protein
MRGRKRRSSRRRRSWEGKKKKSKDENLGVGDIGTQKTCYSKYFQFGHITLLEGAPKLQICSRRLDRESGIEYIKVTGSSPMWYAAEVRQRILGTEL